MTDDHVAMPAGGTDPDGTTAEVDRPTRSSQKIEAGPRRQRHRWSPFRQVQFVTTVLTALTAVAALILSLMSTEQLNRRPAMTVAMPKIIRITQVGNATQGPGWVAISIQPTFAVDRKTDRSTVVTALHLTMIPPPGNNSLPPYFYWLEIVQYTQSQASIVGQYLSDPTPFAVTQEKPEFPTLQFRAESPVVTVGKWKGTLTTERLDQSPLKNNFCIDISPDNLSFLTKTGISNFLTMRNDQTLQSAQSTSPCYHSP